MSSIVLGLILRLKRKPFRHMSPPLPESSSFPDSTGFHLVYFFRVHINLKSS